MTEQEILLWEKYERYLDNIDSIRRGLVDKGWFMRDTYFNEWLRDGWIKELT